MIVPIIEKQLFYFCLAAILAPKFWDVSSKRISYLKKGGSHEQ
ncbi:MAG: hypothetical protein SRB1_01160 [Desulfobacteraceae bacterium Eth-SRB1]|nr:MAG: hypothetical protein SRB2_04885 [Desulfobacteraceae bacterium Eth-SRB2]RZB33386.1 MAG: hypothetical protein SRB1_01160 [Desulfobacteraceae bacterium Eth-SRB1]